MFPCYLIIIGLVLLFPRSDFQNFNGPSSLNKFRSPVPLKYLPLFPEIKWTCSLVPQNPWECLRIVHVCVRATNARTVPIFLFQSNNLSALALLILIFP